MEIKKNKTVYIGLSADVLHHGHINLINKAKKYGQVILGLLSDKAVTEKKKNVDVILVRKISNSKKHFRN